MRLGHAGEKALQTLVNRGVLKGVTTVHLVNRLPVSGNGGKTPLETQSWILEQKKPSLWALVKA